MVSITGGRDRFHLTLPGFTTRCARGTEFKEKRYFSFAGRRRQMKILSPAVRGTGLCTGLNLFSGQSPLSSKRQLKSTKLCPIASCLAEAERRQVSRSGKTQIPLCSPCPVEFPSIGETSHGGFHRVNLERSGWLYQRCQCTTH